MFKVQSIVLTATLFGYASVASTNATNTNACIQKLPNLDSCSSGVTDACCIAVFDYETMGCGCNPVVPFLSAQAAYGFAALLPACKDFSANQEGYPEAPAENFDCNNIRKHLYGCGDSSDMDLDLLRIKTALALSETMISFYQLGGCFNFPAFQGSIATHLTANPSASIPYGIGRYQGLQYMTEYFGIADQTLNHGFWHLDTFESTELGFIQLSDDGKNVIVGGPGVGSFDQTRLPYDTTPDVVITIYDFEVEDKCNSKVNDLSAAPNAAFAGWVNSFTSIANNFNQYGTEDICRTHTKYCLGANSQFVDYDECVAFMNTKPQYSAACGSQLPLGGDSLTCRFKHHFMIPLAPATHCPHISDASNKCNDNFECTAAHVAAAAFDPSDPDPQVFPTADTLAVLASEGAVLTAPLSPEVAEAAVKSNAEAAHWGERKWKFAKIASSASIGGIVYLVVRVHLLDLQRQKQKMQKIPRQIE
eukprot:CAMPEP_0202010218 /NCGR_PEP_ID=MMETSP0905-20130828/17196_1 /ASSEMBLY_ACC=CAM_ASM_000554 /TAXON_ID=420261 /ORGANISM="Thalassiosira antarctica, Strain CCMP982" /LENGTH=476 /DNA_ID=CAMNT_0048568811 /DNA_START=21 /DNA_END=1450 /DNA_ORIENTATION=+